MGYPLQEKYKHTFDTREWLHFLWGKAVGTPAYNKSEWEEFRYRIERLFEELERKHGDGKD